MIPEAVNILAGNVGQQWKDIAKSLGISQRVLTRIEQQEVSDKCRMSKCIQLLPKLQWHNVKGTLKMFKRDDIIELITRKTLITNGKSLVNFSFYFTTSFHIIM
jgi:Death domain.